MTPSPFKPKSDEEEVKSDEPEEDKKGDKDTKKEASETNSLIIDFDGIGRRTLALPLPSRNYGSITAGPKGTAFIAEYIPNSRGATLHKFSLKDQKAEEFTGGISSVFITPNGEHLLGRFGSNWKSCKNKCCKCKRR
jgi:tricorn protease